MKKKVLIVGGDGMAGNIVNTYLKENNYTVYTTTRRELGNKQFFYDVVNDVNSLSTIISEINPDYVINCIGVLNQFAEDNKDEAVLINSYLPHYIDRLSEKQKFKFIHISTDCVFSGKKGNYREEDFPDAESWYGRSKALGEIDNSRSLTLRTSIVGPDVNKKGIGLFHWFMQQQGEIKGFTKVFWSGVTTLELAKSIEKSFDMNIYGLYHLVNNRRIDKYNLLLLFKEFMNKRIKISKNHEQVSDKTLLNNRIDFDFQIPSYKVMIQEMAIWIDKHNEQYKYNLINKNNEE